MPRRYADAVPAQATHPASGPPRPHSAPPVPYSGAPQYPPPGYQPAPPALSPGGAPLAEFGDRFVARLIDVVIMGIVTFVVLIPVTVVALILFFDAGSTQVRLNEDPFAPLPPDEPTAIGVVLGILALIVAELVITLLITYIYDVVLMHRSGQTVGKRIMKLRVVPVDPAATLTKRMADKRYLVEHVAAFFVPGLNILDGLWQVWDKPYRQCLHDKFAQTIVVKVNP